MKSLLPPFALLAAFGGFYLMQEPERAGAPEPVPYAFNPTEIRQNICGPVGTKRGILFRPDVAHLLSNAAFADDVSDMDVPLIEGLDDRDFPISSEVALTRAYFRQGFALLYGFNHWEAVRAFKKAQELDPECAICYWGEAYALGPNINAPMDEAAHAQAVVAVEQAHSLRQYANEREAQLIDALRQRYSMDENVTRAELDQKYADAMAGVVKLYPNDQDIATLYAESLMDASPWDYWERDFTTPKPHIQIAIDTIEKVLATNPDHYGAIHLYIHLYEASSIAAKAEPYADKLAGLAPGAGHLVHMPGHIYYRIGRYLDSLETNIKAVAVDEAYLASTSGSNLYRFGYYPHNVHFVLVSAQMASDGAVALEYAAKLDALIPLEVLREAAWIAPIKAAPYFVQAQFSSLDEVLALPDPGEDFAYIKAMWHYARGTALAAAGDARAEAEIEAIEALLEHEEIKNASIPAVAILRVARDTVEGRYLMSQGKHLEAVPLFEKAVASQDSMSYTEPPFWYYAAEQSLGAAYYEAGRYDDAENAFKASLVRHPNSAWSLFGLWQTQVKLGRDGEAAMTKKLLERASHNSENVPFIKL